MGEEVIKTGAQLYRVMKDRGLELRTQGNGRDNEVYRNLQALLGCPPEKRLQDYLDNNKDISAAAFLRAFRRVAQPFAQMFEEIWSFLSNAAASLANESIRVRIGYPDASDRIDLDLEAFRRFAEQASRIIQSVVWSRPQLESLIRRGWELQSALGLDPGKVLYGSQPRYEMFEPYALVQAASGLPSAFAEVARGFSEAIEAASHYHPEDGATAWLQGIGVALTDVLPSWVSVLERSADLPQEACRRFSEWFDEEFPRAEDAEDLSGHHEPLDDIDLPFWRHRWHTFEIWISVVVLRTLDKLRFAPRLNVEGNYLPVDGYTRAILAEFSCIGYVPACVAIQVQTKIPDGSGEIRPDLRIFASPRLGADDSLVVVECKQRAKMTAQHLGEVAKKYRAGCPKASGIIVVNYDTPRLAAPSAIGSYSLESVRPRQTAEFEDCLIARIEESGLKPLPHVVVLLDCSASMGASYQNDDVSCALRAVLSVPAIKLYAFANGLLAERPRLDEKGEIVLPPIEGGTAITEAIMSMIEDLGWTPDLLVIVSDGGYERAPILKNLPRVVECAPVDLPSHVGDIVGSVRLDRPKL